MNLQPNNRFIVDSQVFSPSTLGGNTKALLQRHQLHGKRVAIISDDIHALLDAIICFYQEKADGLVLFRENIEDALKSVITAKGYTILFLGKNQQELVQPAQASSCEARPGYISILTSGTTGTPKLIPHTWDSLFTLKHNTGVQALSWLFPYTPGTYAWYQMVTLWMFVENQTIVSAAEVLPELLWDVGVQNQVNAVSATPTFWRYLLLQKGTDELSALSMKQLTLGGEPIDRVILNQLKEIYPAAKLTHIYASSEAGASIVVNDGQAGFPSSWLDESDTKNKSIKIVDNKLFIKSPHRSVAVADWLDTGDVVEIKDERVFIVGREGSEYINVGGQKVYSKLVQDVLLQHPKVAWCRGYGRKAPIVGEMVCAEIVMKKQVAGEPIGDLEKELTAHCNRHALSANMIPRLWRFLEKIPVGKNFKSKV